MNRQEFFFQLDQINEIAHAFLNNQKHDRIFYFKGTLGAGKTTFIKALCAQLAVQDTLSSPSFSIINEYSNNDTNVVVYHMDLYRLKKIEEAESIGLYEYLDSGNYCFIEWPELIEPYYQGTVLQFSIVDQQTRKLEVIPPNLREN